MVETRDSTGCLDPYLKTTAAPLQLKILAKTQDIVNLTYKRKSHRDRWLNGVRAANDPIQGRAPAVQNRHPHPNGVYTRGLHTRRHHDPCPSTT